MKKISIIAIACALPVVAMADSAIDPYNLSQNDMRGTARFMSMGGAFGALGGDLSALQVNPAGIGVYRGSEIGITLDFNIANSTTGTGYDKQSVGKTHVYCNNVGYIGTMRTGSESMPTFSWGVGYNRVASFDRTFRGVVPSLNTSMSDYVAYFSDGYSPDVLGKYDNYNPFYQSSADWMSIMAYNSYMISPSGPNGEYEGLWAPGYTSGNSEFSTRERGYNDEYSINFGGNVMNTVYWGLGIGISDINYTTDTFYGEDLYDANVFDKQNDRITPGDAYFALRNHSNTSGSGFNLKLGVILKPINELRIGVAFHTPTWYNLSAHYASTIDYDYIYNFNAEGKATGKNADQFYSDDSYYDWHMRTPWKFVSSLAGVIGGRFILSADYEYKAFDNIRVSVPTGYGDFQNDELVESDVKAYYKPVNTLRLGAEYRVTPQFSLRAGYSYSTTSVTNAANNNDIYIVTSGTNPAYTFNKDTQYVTCGIGYRSGGFYFDAAYVYKKQNSTWHGFSSFDYYSFNDQRSTWVDGPMSNVATSNNNIVLSIGYKF